MKDTSDETRRQPSWRGAALAAAYGAIAAVLAYVDNGDWCAIADLEPAAQAHPGHAH